MQNIFQKKNTIQKKTIIKLFFLLLLFFRLFSSDVKAQVKKELCQKYIPNNYIINPQEYRAELEKGETKELRVVFYGKNIYRIAVCSDCVDSKIEFSLRDTNGKLLYSNKMENYKNFKDFQFASTVDCFISIKTAKDYIHICNVLFLLAIKKND